MERGFEYQAKIRRQWRLSTISCAFKFGIIKLEIRRRLARNRNEVEPVHWTNVMLGHPSIAAAEQYIRTEKP